MSVKYTKDGLGDQIQGVASALNRMVNTYNDMKAGKNIDDREIAWAIGELNEAAIYLNNGS